MRARVLLTRLATGLRTKPKASSQGRRAIVREAQKVESLRLAHPALAPVQIREPAKLHEAGLVLVEAETESGQPLPNVAEVPLRIPLVLEPDNDIVSVTDDDRFAIRDVRAPFLVEPQVEHVMQEHVRQDGGDYCPLRRAHTRTRPSSTPSSLRPPPRPWSSSLWKL